MKIKEEDLVDFIYFNMTKNLEHDRFRITLTPYDELVEYLNQKVNIEKLKECLNDKLGKCIIKFEYIDILEEYHLDIHKVG